MKYSTVVKTIAILLTACCLLTIALCTFGIIVLSELELYGGDYDSFVQSAQEVVADDLATRLAYSYAVRNLGEIPPSVAESFGYVADVRVVSDWFGLEPGLWGYSLYSEFPHELLETAPLSKEVAEFHSCSFLVDSSYMITTDKALSQLVYQDNAGNPVYYRWVNGPAYQVELTFSESAMRFYEDIPMQYIRLAAQWRYSIIFLLIGALVLFILLVVYLCCAAGRSVKGAPVRPGGLNRLPLDLYTAAVGFADYVLAVVVFVYLVPMCVTNDNYLNPGMLTLTCLVLFLGLLLLIGWFFAVVAQIKARHFFWWHHSVIGWTLGKIWAGIRAVCGFLWRGCIRMLELLPMAIRRILVVLIIAVLAFFIILLIASGWTGLGVLLLLVLSFWSIGLFAYDIYCYSTVMQGAKRMASGELTHKIPTGYLLGGYKDHAKQLNTMADVAIIAAQKQTQSERMKTELITNVSHDIKTPLTSIINYVDLLQKPHTEEEAQQYLEVLNRQSHRMKKLLEDLMEMSKASTGNITAEITRINSTEAVNQALGEFSDKLAAAQLTPVFRSPAEPVYVQADGRLTWRVLSNILSNTVKYAMPGTRVYLDLVQTEHRVQLSVKNISREELNVTAEELTERFVRGDASRNTEGSGLGLNIAKSLMELQKGDLALTVDGDLFKVTLTFPAG